MRTVGGITEQTAHPGPSPKARYHPSACRPAAPCRERTPYGSRWAPRWEADTPLSGALTAPREHAERAERGLLVLGRGAHVRRVVGVVGDHVQDRDARVPRDGVGQVAP